MFRELVENESGRWFHYGSATPRDLSAYSPIEDGGVTVFWGGLVGVAGLSEFVVIAANLISLPSFSPVRIETLESHEDGVRRSSSTSNPVFTDNAEQAIFIRFDCLVSGRSRNRIVRQVVVWAKLNDKDEKSIDSIGVQIPRSRIRQFLPVLSNFVAATSNHSISEDLAEYYLRLFEKDVTSNIPSRLPKFQ